MLNRDDVRKILIDREWHTAIEIVNSIGHLVRPEEASHRFFRENPRIANEVPLEVAVARGTEALIRDVMRSAIMGDFVERAGPKPFVMSRYRWIAWYCWSCGTKIFTYERTGHGLCVNCQDATKGKQDASITTDPE